MASTSKRPPNLTTLTPYAKPTITVEEWEASAPLGEVEARSVSYVQSANERSALPLKVRVVEAFSDVPHNLSCQV